MHLLCGKMSPTVHVQLKTTLRDWHKHKEIYTHKICAQTSNNHACVIATLTGVQLVQEINPSNSKQLIQRSLNLNCSNHVLTCCLCKLTIT